LEVSDLGIANPGLSTWAVCSHGATTYVPTRRGNPVKVGVFDHDSGTFVETISLPNGQGCNAATATEDAAYVATYGQGGVYRIPHDDRKPELVAEESWDDITWSLEVASDGTIYAGTSNNSHVYEINPENGEVSAIGPMAESEKYAYDLVVTDRYVYVGVGNTQNGGLYRIDREDHATTRIFEDDIPTWAFKIRANDKYFVAYMREEGRAAIIDFEDGELASTVDHFVTEPLTAEWALGTAQLDDTKIYYPASASKAEEWPDDDVHDPNTAAMYAYDIDARSRSKVVDLSEFENVNDRSNLVSGPRFIGVGGYGLFNVDIDSGDHFFGKLHDLGMEYTAGSNMSVGKYDGNPITARGGTINVHDVDSGTRTEVPGAGEAKTMVEAQGKLYIGKYNGAEFRVYDGDSIRSLGAADGQSRPLDIVYNENVNTVIMGTQPDYGAATGGAIATLDLDTNEITTHENILEDQSVHSLATRGDVLFAGGSRRRGIGTDAVTSKAKFAKFKLPSLEKVWEKTPAGGAWSVIDTEIVGDRVFGMTLEELFYFDLESDTVGDVVDFGPRSYYSPGPGERLYAISNKSGEDSDIAGGLVEFDGGELTVNHFVDDSVFATQGESQVIGENIYYVDSESWHLMEISGIGGY
jgi:outer membrane protein assembly factor BamB